jgi:hypothetical protein
VIATLWLLSVLLLALSAGAAFTHVLEIPGKRELSPQAAVIVQQRLYRGYRTAGTVIEPAQLLVLAATAAAVGLGGGASFWLTVAALAMTAATMVVFAVWTDPANRVMAQWSADRPPLAASWRARRSWEISHATRALLFLLAIALVFAAVVTR